MCTSKQHRKKKKERGRGEKLSLRKTLTFIHVPFTLTQHRSCSCCVVSSSSNSFVLLSSSLSIPPFFHGIIARGIFIHWKECRGGRRNTTERKAKARLVTIMPIIYFNYSPSERKTFKVKIRLGLLPTLPFLVRIGKKILKAIFYLEFFWWQRFCYCCEEIQTRGNLLQQWVLNLILIYGKII